jgi:glutaminyl-peptide cyclotransferase
MVFFDGEEAFKEWTDTDSLYGSRHLAEKWLRTPASSVCRDKSVATELDRIELFVLLDLLGTKNPTIPSFFRQTDEDYKILYHLERNLHSMGLLGSPRRRHHFNGRGALGHVQDDHIPFLRRGVKKILHIIPPEFPSVWHKMSDNASALDHDTIRNWIILFKGFVVQYLQLDMRSLKR